MWRTRLVMCACLVMLVSCKSATSPTCSGSCVTIKDFSFSPATLSVKAGTTVQWINSGPSSHTTTSDGGVWNSGTLSAPSGGGAYGGGSAGGTYQFTFNTPGTYPYHCSIHPPSIAAYAGFTGTITVTQ
jgi:plastocyanin